MAAHQTRALSEVRGLSLAPVRTLKTMRNASLKLAHDVPILSSRGMTAMRNAMELILDLGNRKARDVIMTMMEIILVQITMQVVLVLVLAEVTWRV